MNLTVQLHIRIGFDNTDQHNYKCIRLQKFNTHNLISHILVSYKYFFLKNKSRAIRVWIKI